MYGRYEPVQFLRVQNRIEKTLKCVLDTFIEPGSAVWTDRLTGCSESAMSNFKHDSENRKEHFLVPDTGCNTQKIDRARLDLKDWYRWGRGNRQNLQIHLDFAAWRRFRSSAITNKTLFDAFLADMAQFPM